MKKKKFFFVFTGLLYRSLKAGRVINRTILLKNSIGKIRTASTVHLNKMNRGDTRVVHKWERCIGACPQKVYSILLKDLTLILPSNLTKWILKLDCQGCELDAIFNSGKLLDNIKLIIMEWFLIKAKKDSKQLILFLLSKNFIPYGYDETLLNPYEFQDWPFDILWKKDEVFFK